MDKLLNEIKFDKKTVLYMIIIILSGVVCGSLFIVLLNDADKKLVLEYVSSFIENVSKPIDNILLLKNTLINNFSFLLLIWIIGLTYILFPVNILVLFYKSFVLGFSISSFIYTKGIKGIILSIIYIFPHNIINILVYGVLTAYTARLSLNMIKSYKANKSINIRQIIKKYTYTFFFLGFILLLSILFESFITPKLFLFTKGIY